MTFLWETPATTKIAKIFCDAFLKKKNTYTNVSHPELISFF
jgi:hypothetical protein